MSTHTLGTSTTPTPNTFPRRVARRKREPYFCLRCETQFTVDQMVTGATCCGSRLANPLTVEAIFGEQK